MAQEVSTETAERRETSTLAMIARAASDPNVSVEKMVELNNLHERILDREARQAYTAAFAAASLEMPSIARNGSITNNSGQVQSRFSRWEDIDRIIRPILSRHGLVLSFELSEAAGKALAVCAVLTHTGGHRERSGPMPLPLDNTGNKNGVQGTGSSMSYGKRYATIAMLNIVTHDDTDGSAPAGNLDAADSAKRLIYEEAKNVAENDGVNAYSAHFRNMPRAAKLWIVQAKNADGVILHDELKKIAADADARFDAKERGQ